MNFVPTKCAICGTSGDSEKVFDQNLDEDSFSAMVFSARRLPDRRSYQWVRCKNCGLLRSDPVFDADLKSLYEKSSFNYDSEVDGLKEVYASITLRALKPNLAKGAMFEIGGGNGFFLEVAKELGFNYVVGVEPSVEAVAAARDDIKPFMIVDMLRSYSVTPETFDVVAMFHVLDHLPNPKLIINICKSALRPGGTFVVAVHDSRSWSAKLLKSRSPIIDLEHTYLYDKKTVRKLFEAAGLEDIRVGSYWNLYSLAYLIHLLPISNGVKITILKGRLGETLRKFRIYVPLGNLWASGVRPL